MLIKKRKLVSVSGGRETARASQPEHGALQLEIQKAKQEIKQIKNEAQLALAESEQKLKMAEAKAKEIITSANLEAKIIKEKVYKETLEAAEEEAELIKEQAKSVLRELFEVKREALTQANKEIIKVALDLAEKIIRYKVSVDPNVLQTQVLEAIKKATSEADRVQVFVNPADLKVLEDSIPQMEKLFPSGIDIIPLANDSVDPGSCIVETKSGQLDTRFSTQLQALTNLIDHIEVIEPQVEINEEMPSYEASLTEVQEEISPLIENNEEELAEFEKEILEKEILNEQVILPAVPLEPEEEVIPLQEKRLNISEFTDRTKEEAEELDEGLVFEYEEEEVKPINILKPKKSRTEEVSNIASELEENPEWKDLVEEDEE